MTRQEKINILMAQDIISIKDDMEDNNYEVFCAMLQGDGWKQYNECTDDEIDMLFDASWSDITEDHRILELAHKLNGKPIKLV